MEETRNIVAGLADRLGAAQGMIEVLEAEQSPDQVPRGRGALKMLAHYYQKAAQAQQRQDPIAWVNFAVPPELFYALGIMPIYLDHMFGVEAAFPGCPEGVTKYIDIAHQYVPDHLCSANKIFLGAVVSGDIPKPALMVHSSHPCDSNLAVYPVVCESLGIPYYCIDVPYWSDERSFEYMAGELGRLMSFLETHTGRKMEFDRLRQVIDYSNQAHEYILELNELAKAVPCPYSSYDSLTEYPLYLTLGGTPELVDYCERSYEITKDLVDKGQGHLAEEKIRLVWIAPASAFDPAILSWLEQEHGAVSIYFTFNLPHKPIEDTSDIDKILRGLAHKTVALPMGRECRGAWENNAKCALDMCREYKADAAVFAGHIACKHMWAIAKLLEDRIRDELNIPTLVFERDVLDLRVASVESIKAKFEEFLSVHFPE